MGEVMKEASFSLAEGKFTAGDFGHIILQNVSKAQVKTKMRKDNVAGVTLPIFEAYQDGPDSKWFGFCFIGRELQKSCRVDRA